MNLAMLRGLWLVVRTAHDLIPPSSIKDWRDGNCEGTSLPGLSQMRGSGAKKSSQIFLMAS